MGKLLLIMILVVAVIFTVISVSLRQNSENAPDKVATGLTKIQINSLCENALNYGIKRFKEKNLNYVHDIAILSFNNFSVNNGYIDSILFTFDKHTTYTTIEAYVSYQMNGTTNIQKSSALVSGSSAEPIVNILSSNKDVDVDDDTTVNGIIVEDSNPKLKLKDYFTVDDKYIKKNAPNYYKNPPDNPMPAEDVTYIELKGKDASFDVTSSAWSGTGVLVIKGDANFSSGQFNGVIWVSGKLSIDGDFALNGAIFAEKDIEIEDSSCSLTYSSAIVEQAIAEASLPFGAFELLSWFDE
ncbi:hypothetical protein ACFLYJ_00625 [Candidatus Cloacimonadota bacterium]